LNTAAHREQLVAGNSTVSEQFYLQNLYEFHIISVCIPELSVATATNRQDINELNNLLCVKIVTSVTSPLTILNAYLAQHQHTELD
jgi:hypothetical protein